MKTILVVYTNTALTIKQVSEWNYYYIKNA